jgi:hypothetical protein
LRISIECMCNSETAESPRFHSRLNKTPLQQLCWEEPGGSCILSPRMWVIDSKPINGAETKLFPLHASSSQRNLSPISWALQSSVIWTRGSRWSPLALCYCPHPGSKNQKIRTASAGDKSAEAARGRGAGAGKSKDAKEIPTRYRRWY